MDCAAEVNEVCNSKPMKDFELCAYECGLYDPAAPNGLRKNGTLVCPPECTMDGYDFTFMCDDSRDPQYRAHEDRQERIDSCQTMSMVSDVPPPPSFLPLPPNIANHRTIRE